MWYNNYRKDEREEIKMDILNIIGLIMILMPVATFIIGAIFSVIYSLILFLKYNKKNRNKKTPQG